MRRIAAAKVREHRRLERYETARPVMPPPAAAAPPAEAKEPAKAPAAADNPFGDAAGAKEAAPPAEKKPDENPFGS